MDDELKLEAEERRLVQLGDLLRENERAHAALKVKWDKTRGRIRRLNESIARTKMLESERYVN